MLYLFSNFPILTELSGFFVRLVQLGLNKRLFEEISVPTLNYATYVIETAVIYHYVTQS